MASARAFLIRWVLASMVGLAVGLPAGFAVGVPLEAIVGMMLVTPLMLAFGGSILGAAQWLVLRRRLIGSGWWVAVSAIGLGVGLTAGVVAVEVGGQVIVGQPVRIATTGSVGPDVEPCFGFRAFEFRIFQRNRSCAPAHHDG